MVRALIFDVGGVLAYDVWEHLLLDKGDASDPSKPAGIAAQYGLPENEVERVGRKLWKIYSRAVATSPSRHAGTEDDYWAAFIQELQQYLPSNVRPSDLKAHTDPFIRAVNQPAMESLLEDLKSKDIRLVLCSDNTEFWFQRQMAKLGLDRYFSPQHCFVSCRIGFSKDSPGFQKFRAISEALKIEKSSCLFVDDRRKNVELALAYGFTPILFPSHSPKGFAYLSAIFAQMQI